MNRSSQRYPVELFIGLVLLLTFDAYLLPLPSESKPIRFPIVVAFIPALVATGLTVSSGGRKALRSLYNSLRPGKLSWLVFSILVGASMQAAISLLALLLGYISPVRVATSPQLIALAILTPLLALGEELGWRGYALPKLLASQTRLSASVITGIPWALVHLALFLPGMMFVGRPLVAQIMPVAFFSIVHAWVFIKSGGSVLAPTLLHGTFNFMGALINSDLAVTQATYLGAVVLLGSALILVAVKPTYWLQKENTFIESIQFAAQ